MKLDIVLSFKTLYHLLTGKIIHDEADGIHTYIRLRCYMKRHQWFDDKMKAENARRDEPMG